MSQEANKERQIFAEAVELPAERRAAFLKDVCGTDGELLERVQELLDAYSDESPVLKTVTAPELTNISEGPGTRIGRYKLLQKIGEGGMGVVYMAEQEEPVRRRVALKIIKLGMDTRQVVARFEAERQALALMDHPNIARVLDGGATETGRPYFVMELVQGVPITEFCDKNRLPAKERLKLFVQVCQAIQSAHQKGIIHRDIKPSNVLVTLHHGDPMPKVIDFGIAKATNQKLTEKTLFTQHATMIGTPAYMSPEQAEMSSIDVDTRTDVYALGVLLYELLTGTTPFPEKRLRSLGYGEMQRVIMEEEPERPSTRLSTMANEQKTAVARNHGEEFAALSKLLRGDLDWIVMKCLEKDRTRRYETASGLARDIERHLNTEPIVARPPSAAYRFQKLVRRNKLAFAAAIALTSVAAFAAALTMIVWQSVSNRSLRAGNLKSLAIVLRASDPSSSTLAQDWSRDLSHLFSRLSGLKTVDRTQVLKWETSKEPVEKIGQALGTSAVLLGQLRQAEGRVRLDVELVAFPSKERIWAHGFTQTADDWDSTLSQIAREVITKLGLSPTAADQALLRRPLSQNPDALKAYYRARNFSDALDDASLQSAITNFEAAIRLDPKFAHAHAGLGEACISMTLMDYAPAPLMAKARESIQAALKIDPRLPEARMADGILKFFYEWDWTGAQKSLDEAMRLDVSAVEANACYLHLLDVYGQGEPALKTVQMAVALHPGSKAIQAELGCAAYYAGPSHFAQAESYSRESLENDPDNGVIYFLLARTLVQEAKYDDARTFLKIGKSKPGGNWSALDAELAYLHARKGETNQAHELIAALKAREQTEYIDPYVYAMIYAGLRDSDKVFENLNLACDTKSGWIPSLPVEPKFNEYRNDPRYREILARLKLPAPP